MKFDAFISYSHRQDSHLAPNMEKALEQFAKPAFKRRALNIFRDSNDLSVSPDLWGKIEEGLNASKFFIFCASPEAAQSHYCGMEVDYWLKNKSADNFLIALTDGEIKWDHGKNDFNWEETTSIPKNLSGIFNNEPLYVDFRNITNDKDLTLKNIAFRSDIVQLAATLHGKSVGDLVGEDMKQHKRLMRIRNLAIAVLSVLLLASAISTFVAIDKKNEADEQRILAETETRRVLLSNYISAIQSEFPQDPTKALRLAEYAYNYAKRNELSTKVAAKHLIKVFYSGYGFYQEGNINSESRRDRVNMKPPPRDYNCWYQEDQRVDKSDIPYSVNNKYAIDGNTLIEPSLFSFCNTYFPSYRTRLTIVNQRFPVSNLYFIQNGQYIESKYVQYAWDPNEYRQLGDGFETYYYHRYKTGSHPYVEDRNNDIAGDTLRTFFYGDGKGPDDMNWSPELGQRDPARPIALVSPDSTKYMTNEGLFNKDNELLISMILPLDELMSNYTYAFSKDDKFLYVFFRPVGPLKPELDRRWIYALDPELILVRMNNELQMGHIAELTTEDKERFLIAD